MIKWNGTMSIQTSYETEDGDAVESDKRDLDFQVSAPKTGWRSALLAALDELRHQGLDDIADLFPRGSRVELETHDGRVLYASMASENVLPCRVPVYSRWSPPDGQVYMTDQCVYLDITPVPDIRNIKVTASIL